MAITNTNIIKYLDIELQAKITEVLDKTEAKDLLDASLRILEQDIERLKAAFASLSGPVLPGTTSQSPEPEPTREPAVPPVSGIQQKQPECQSCGGSMYYQARTLGSGRIINLWVCSECSNERM